VPAPVDRPRPSARLDARAWAATHDRLLESLRALIRIPSINPPDPAAPAGELDAARWIAAALGDSGLAPEVIEPVPGRGSVVARLRGDGTGGEPLLLLSHLDVVPAPPEQWHHDPFGGEVADGYLYGRGALDMKDLVAMELEVVRLLAQEAHAAGRDPAADPVPGLRRDILFTCTADEEAGGLAGVAWLAQHRPETLRAAGAINEAGAASVPIGGRRLYPIQVAEKGYAVYRLAIHGTWGHGSMPRPDNAELLAGEAIGRLARPGRPHVTALMRTFLEGAAEALAGSEPRTARVLSALASGDERPLDEAASDRCSPYLVRVIRALVRDTISPNIVHAGVKYNVIPGEAVIEIDCRRLPGTSEAEMRREVVERLGPDLAPRTTIELLLTGEGVEAPADSALFEALAEAVAAADPEGVPLPVMAPFGTDAKHLVALGVPTYGFSPLRYDPEEGFLERWHGVDERVSIEGLRWGLPVLYDAVRRFCG
jgi:acetylornithine deacetylase/succinyl-diaminopimelate desuccinylase-like protein